MEVYAGAASDGSVLTVADENIILEAMKPAEDGSGDLVLRFYESVRTKTETELYLALPCTEIAECNMLEADGKPLAFEASGDGVRVKLAFRPFEIKTLRIKA